MKLIKALCLILVFASACTGPKVPPVSPDLQAGTPTVAVDESTSTAAVISSSPTTTHTATPKPTLTHTPTVTFTPTPLPPVMIADGVNPIEIDGFSGIWSPAENEMVGIHITETGSGVVALMSEPGFLPTDVPIGNASLFGTDITWTPDGKAILFGGPVNSQGQLELPVSEISDLWIMNSDNFNPRKLQPGFDAARFLTFSGWFDERSVVVSGYTGAGSKTYVVLDYKTGRMLAYASEVVGDIFQANSSYIPGVYDTPPSAQLFVISKTRQNENTGWIISDYVHYFPGNILPGDRRENNLLFQDWLPGSNQMLASWFSDEESLITAARMILWEVKTDEVTPLLAGGVDGSYSTNGKWLAIASVETDVDRNSPAELSLAPVSSERTFLVLIDTNTNEIVADLPVITAQDSWSYLFPVYTTYADFSPDDRYLAFLSPITLEVDDTGWPVWSGGSISDGRVQLNIIDLEQRRLLFAVDAETSSLLWSPDGKHLLFVGPSGFWEILDVSTGDRRELVSIHDELQLDPAWSFDGQWIAFSYWNGQKFEAPGEIFPSRKINTLIFEVQ